MIDKLFNEACAFLDELNADNDKIGYQTMKEFLGRMQYIYDYGQQKKIQRTRIGTTEDDKLEVLIQTIPGIKTYYDPTDKTYWYEIDGWQKDDMYEVVEYLIDERRNSQMKMLAKMRNEAIFYFENILKHTPTLEWFKQSYKEYEKKRK